MNAHTTTGAAGTVAPAAKYLTFALAGEEYGVPVLRVREIVRMMDITEVPQVPPHVRGVLNLRGRVVPVIDLRLKLGFPKGDLTSRTCIVIVEVTLASGGAAMGVVVDHVSEVLSLAPEDVEQMPAIGDRGRTDYVTGVATVKGSVKILLDLDRVLGVDDAVARDS